MKYMFGLSATPTRKDGLSKVFHSFLGPIFYKAKRTSNNNVEINVIEYNDNC